MRNLRYFDKKAIEWNGETIEGKLNRVQFELIELALKKFPAYCGGDMGGRYIPFYMMLLHKFKAQYYMLTRRYRLVEQELLYAMGVFEKNIARKDITTNEYKTDVLHYTRCISSLWQFYKVQGIAEDKKAKLISYLDVFAAEDLQDEEVAELRKLLIS